MIGIKLSLLLCSNNLLWNQLLFAIYLQGVTLKYNFRCFMLVKEFYKIGSLVFVLQTKIQNFSLYNINLEKLWNKLNEILKFFSNAAAS